ncbi:phage terminase large subunit [Romboutsia sp.]|uniref:phage terminase large subunit n=1 Tax=Romboutsia sp. TaxID=1965302 RepID=UPI003F2DF2AB
MRLKRFDFYASINKYAETKYTKKQIDAMYYITDDTLIDFESLYTLSEKQKIIFDRTKNTNQIILAHGAKRAGKTKAMILSSLKDIYDYSRIPNRRPAIFLVTSTTERLASAHFLQESNDIFEQAGLKDRFNDSGHVSSCKIFGITVWFLGLSRTDAYSKIKGQTVFGWLGTEITEYDKINFEKCFDRLSAGKANIYFDSNPNSTSHWVFKDYIIKNRKVKLGTKSKISLLHFNYLDSLSLFEGVNDFWALQENIYKGKNTNISTEDMEALYTKLLKREYLEVEDKEAFNIISKCNIQETELSDKFGFWVASQNEPLKNLTMHYLDKNIIRQCYSVAFLDLANTANENSCYTALAIAYRYDTPISHCYYFIGKLFAKPYYETYDQVIEILEEFEVNNFYFDLHGAGVGMKDLPQFSKYGGIGLLQSRNKLSRISDMSLLIDNGVLKASSFCENDFFHQVKSFRFAEKADNNNIVVRKIKGYCDAPDALESALRVLIKGAERFNEDDKEVFKSI